MRLKVNGDILRKQREKLGLTQVEMATLVSLKRDPMKRLGEQMYQKIEQGHRTADIETAKIIAKFTDVPLAVMFSFKDKRVRFASQKPPKRF